MIVTYAAFPGCLPEGDGPTRHSSMREAIKHLLEEAKDRHAESALANNNPWLPVILDLSDSLHRVCQNDLALGDYGIGVPDGTIWYAVQAEDQPEDEDDEDYDLMIGPP